MQTTLLAALLACGSLAGSAWLCASGGTTAQPGPTAVIAATEVAALAGIEDRFARIAEPLPVAEQPLGPIWAAAPEPVAAEPLVVAPEEAERIARRYFHAQVTLEELERALPPESEADPRTPASFPGYFAAMAERDQYNAELAQLPAPARDEPLPVLDLYAEGDDFERIYRNWTREDLLLENWRISRAAYAESARVLADRLTNGPYDTKPIGQLFTIG